MSVDDASEAEGKVPDDLLPSLVRAAAGGDSHAWKQLVERFADLVWSICRSYRLTDQDAADAVQLTWLHLLEHLDRIRDPQRLAGWLATTCRRECQALLRRSRSSVSVEQEYLDRLTSIPGGGFEPVGRCCRL
jgi:DNA-directed RNA polymerase specialized sigma24 family protein